MTGMLPGPGGSTLPFRSAGGSNATEAKNPALKQLAPLPSMLCIAGQILP